MKYMHYGNNKFNINEFEKISNNPKLTKPEGGLWASRVITDFGWKDLCLKNEYKFDIEKYFLFSLNKNAKILIIDNCEKLKELPQINPNIRRKVCTILDFEELAKYYDAIEVLISKDSKLYFELYGWECDSILIMNPNVIIQE